MPLLELEACSLAIFSSKRVGRCGKKRLIPYATLRVGCARLGRSDHKHDRHMPTRCSPNLNPGQDTRLSPHANNNNNKLRAKPPHTSDGAHAPRVPEDRRAHAPRPTAARRHARRSHARSNSPRPASADFLLNKLRTASAAFESLTFITVHACKVLLRFGIIHAFEFRLFLSFWILRAPRARTLHTLLT